MRPISKCSSSVCGSLRFSSFSSLCPTFCYRQNELMQSWYAFMSICVNCSTLSTFYSQWSTWQCIFNCSRRCATLPIMVRALTDRLNMHWSSMSFASLSGMYVTIPILHVALFLLSIERAVSYSGSGTILSKLVARSCVTQTILWFLWALSIVVTIAWLTFKNHFTRILFENQFASVLRLAVDEIVNQLGRRSYRCSIDGRLPAGFKIVLSILFILLVVVIVKALIISTGVQCLIPSCCQRKKANRNQHRSRATLSLIAILLLNVFFSLPFYAASIFTSVFSKFDWSKATFSKILRILFLLRLLSIVFQCLVFYLLDEEPCPLVTKCINCAIGPGRHPSQATRQRVNNSGQSLVAKLKRKDQANDGTYAQINPTTRRKPVSRRKMTVKDLSEIDSTEAVFVANRSVETRSADEIVDETKVVTLKSKASNKPAPLELPTQKKRRVDGNNSDDLYANSLLVRTTCDDSTVSSSSERLATPPIRKKRVRSASSRSKRMTKTHLSTVSPKSPATKSPSRSNRDVLNDENSDV